MTLSLGLPIVRGRSSVLLSFGMLDLLDGLKRYWLFLILSAAVKNQLLVIASRVLGPTALVVLPALLFICI
jgi:hypothetical protein